MRCMDAWSTTKDIGVSDAESDLESSEDIESSWVSAGMDSRVASGCSVSPNSISQMAYPPHAIPAAVHLPHVGRSPSHFNFLALSKISQGLNIWSPVLHLPTTSTVVKRRSLRYFPPSFRSPRRFRYSQKLVLLDKSNLDIMKAHFRNAVRLLLACRVQNAESTMPLRYQSLKAKPANS